MKLSEALEIFFDAITGEVSPETLRWYQEKLRPLEAMFGETDIEEITTEDLRKWRRHLMNRPKRWVTHPHKPSVDGPLSPHTVNGHIRACRRFFRWLTEEKYIVENPAQRLKNVRTPDEEPKAASEEDILRLLQAAAETSARDYALVCFLVDTGARARGVVTLTLDRLDLERRRALVVEKSQKREQARRVYFGQVTAEALRKWLAERPHVDHDYVFLNRWGKPLTISGLYQVLKRLARKAGIKGLYNPHSFRHAFAKRMLQQGADLATVSQLMGHRSVDVTARFYARWADDELEVIHDKYSPLNSLLISSPDA